MYIYLDVTVEGKSLGRIVWELFTKEAPSVCEKIITLAKTNELNSLVVSKIVKNFMIKTKLPSKSIEVENQNENMVNIDKPFLLFVSSFDPLSIYITLEPAPHLNTRYVVFGSLVHGKSIIRDIEKIPVRSTRLNKTDSYAPTVEIGVESSGIWNLNDPLPNLIACTDQIGGDIFEEYPDDNIEIEGVDFDSPQSSFKVIEIIKSSGTMLLKNGRLQDALLKYLKAVRYCNELLPDDTNNKEFHDKFQTMKMTLFLNITLVALNMKDYQSCVKYCQYILAMENVELSETQVSKVFYRLSKAYLSLNKVDMAMDALKKASAIIPNDQIIKNELTKVNSIVSQNKKVERDRYSKFFN